MKLTWQDVKEIYHRHNNKIFTCWIAIADELQAHVDAPEPKHMGQMTWEEREERIRKICREEFRATYQGR